MFDTQSMGNRDVSGRNFEIQVKVSVPCHRLPCPCRLNSAAFGPCVQKGDRRVAAHVWGLYQEVAANNTFLWGDVKFTTDDNRLMINLHCVQKRNKTRSTPAVAFHPGIGHEALMRLQAALRPLLPVEGYPYTLLCANFIDSYEGVPTQQLYHTDIRPIRKHKDDWVLRTMLMNVRAGGKKTGPSSPLLYEGKPVCLQHGEFAWFSPTGERGLSVKCA